MKNNILLSFFCISLSLFAQTTHYVNAGMMYFEPSNLIIEQGDEVIWINNGGTHDVNGNISSLNNESFNNPEIFSSSTTNIVGAEIYTHVFTIPGFYNYDCSVYGHASAGMVGTITVNELGSIDCFDDDAAATDLAAVWNPNISGCEAAVEYFISVGYPCSTDLSILGMTGTIADICECSCAEVEEPSTTVVDIIVGSEDHNTLETAVIAAGLVDALSAEGPFTVFAPTDAAFDALPEGTLDAVLADMDLLTAILTHHVASGSVLSTDLSDQMMITTLNGTDLMVSISDNGVMIDNAMVTVADIMADNGVVHVIDAVLIPADEGCENDNNMIEQYFGNFFITECGALINYLEANYGYSQEDACAWNGAPMLDLNGLIISDICECSCSPENVIINENNITKEPLYMIDLLGQVVSQPIYNKPLFIIFNDGSVQKIIINN